MSPKDALYHAVHDCKDGSANLAMRMGIARSSLLNMANPNTEEPGWPLKRVLQVVALTGDTRPVQAICEEAGGVFVPLPSGVVDEDGLMLHLAKAGKEFGDVCASLTRSLEDGRIQPAELKDFHKQVMENIQVLHELDRLVEKRALAQPLFKKPR
jgi:hypothetical protein